ncbi:AAA family ATPase [Parabacteroides sp.]
MKPILFILLGLPGSGKSTLSRFLARKYKIPYLRIDTIEHNTHYEKGTNDR